MTTLRQRTLNNEFLPGAWCNLGSSVTTEIASTAGYDWVLIDLEHGSGTMADVLHQLQGIGCGNAAPIIRIAWNDAYRFKRVLDMGAAGVMVPYISTAEEARRAVEAMRYPPQGIRGVAKLNRATGYAMNFDDYAANANTALVTIVQIETKPAIENIEAIAAVDGVDVLFIGPLDLSTNLGIQQQFDHRDFRDAVAKVTKAARTAGKAAGILLLNPDDAKKAVDDGFTFVAVGSDSGHVAAGMRRTYALLSELKNR